MGRSVPLPKNSSAKLLPSSTSSFSNISPDTSLAFAISLAEAPEFLAAMQEIPPAEEGSKSKGKNKENKENTAEVKKWIMKAAKSGGAGGLRNWSKESWTSFVDLLKVCSIQKKGPNDANLWFRMLRLWIL